VKLTLSVNPGGVFGSAMPRLVLVTASLLTTALVGYFFAVSDPSARLVHVGLALILGGAIGNLYDRLFSVVSVEGFEPIRHHVRDFIDCSALYWPWVFNLADAWLVVGVALMILHWVLAARRQAKQEKTAPKSK
jgi:signal peptidase II